ncbi:MAG: hypothetical protein IKI11_11350, partial [Neisseriaceae bacterium]|nr:hypothetical protein [Neisseriaceae bacterium]
MFLSANKIWQRAILAKCVLRCKVRMWRKNKRSRMKTNAYLFFRLPENDCVQRVGQQSCSPYDCFIRKQDLAAGDFSKVRFVVQSH